MCHTLLTPMASLILSEECMGAWVGERWEGGQGAEGGEGRGTRVGMKNILK